MPWFLAVFLAQTGALWSLARPQRTWSVHPEPPPRVLLAGEEDATALSARFSASARDLFSAPHPAGFSGDAWSRVSRRPRPEVALFSPPPLLAGSADRLGAPFRAWFEEYGEPAFATVAKPRPLPYRDPRIPLPEPAARAIQTPEGFAGRRIQSLPTPPPIQHTNVLRPTLVRVGVDADGRIVSKRLIESSTWAAADRQALDLVDAIQFDARTGPIDLEDPDPIDWGTVAIPWTVTPPAIAEDLSESNP